MSYQSLYRRYRPKRFADVRGQEHVISALKGAVETDSVGHAYLFSGPRGTGKTTSARILAKALNCTALSDGEPCGECESCLSMDSGRSYDLFELDAASNNGVEAMRDLIAKAAVGSPGRTKVYILDEVHMLSTAASNALLKTLEEPPEHVKFVLATTDPQKVLPTIKSRTQHFAFELLTAEQLDEYVRWILNDAGLQLDDDAIDHVVRSGRGSARDTISVLEQVVASGGRVHSDNSVDGIVAAIAGSDVGEALAAADRAIAAGRDPRVLAEATVATLRDVFLAGMGNVGAHIPPADRDKIGSWVKEIRPARASRALELIGSALLEMRQAPEPRIPFEVALVRVTSPSLDASHDALLERIEALERVIASGGAAVRLPDQTPGQPQPASAQSLAPSRQPAPPSSKATSAQPGHAGHDEDSDPFAPSVPARESDPGPPTSRADGVSPGEEARRRLADLKKGRGGDSAESAPTKPVPPPPRIRRQRAEPDTPVTVDNEAAKAEPSPVASSSVDPVSSPDPVSIADASSSTETAAGGIGESGGTRVLDAYQQVVSERLRGVAKALFQGARVVSTTADEITVAFANGPTVDRARSHAPTVETQLVEALGAPCSLWLIVDDDPRPGGRGPAAPNARAPISRTANDRPGGSGAPGDPRRTSRGPNSLSAEASTIGAEDHPMAPEGEGTDPLSISFEDEDGHAVVLQIDDDLRSASAAALASLRQPAPAPNLPPSRPMLRVVRDGETASSADLSTFDGEVDLMGVDIDSLEDAAEPLTFVERIIAMFPGSEELSGPDAQVQ